MVPSNGKFINQLSFKKLPHGGASYYYVELILCKINVKFE